MRLRYRRWAPLLALFLSAHVAGDDGVFDEYRDLMGDDNPAVFVIDEGKNFGLCPKVLNRRPSNPVTWVWAPG